MGNKERIFTKSFFLLFGGLLFTSLVMYALMSTVTEFATSLGTNATVAGLVSGIYIFGGLCSRVYSGNALGKKSWRKIALTFLTIHFLACLLYFLVNNVIFLIIVRFIHGVGFGASSNSIITLASAVLPKQRFGEAFGYLMLGTTIAVGLGPYVSGILYDNFSSVGCFVAASAFSATALICMFILDINKYDPKYSKSKKEKSEVIEVKVIQDNEISDDITIIDDNKEKEEIKERKNIKEKNSKTLEDTEINTNVGEDITEREEIKENEETEIKENNKENEIIKEKEDIKPENKKSYGIIEKVFEIGAIPISFTIALTSLGYVSILSFYRLYADEVKLTSAFSWFFILYSVVLVISRPIAGKIQDKNGDKLICVIGIIAQSVGLALIAHIPNTITVLICAVCAALGFGTLNSAATAIVTRKAPKSRSSYAISTLFIFCDATMGFGPALLGSFVSAKSGYAPVYYISSVIKIVSLPICLLALIKNNN
jgi:MFS family permease